MEQKNYKFQDVCEIVTDYVANGSFKSLADNVQYSDKKDYARLIRLVDFNNNYDEKNAVWVPESSYNFLKKSVLYGDEVIISNVGANLGTVFKCPKLTYPMTLGPNSLLVRTNDLCNQNYLYYYLKSKIGYSKLMALVSGSAMPKFNKTELRNMEISLPDRAYQDKGVEVLIKIDKKIELNNKINNNLHELCNNLYFKLVSQLNATNSSVKSIKNVAKCVLGGTPSRTKKEYWNGTINWINSGEINKFRIIKASEKITELGLNKSSTTLLPRGTTVLAITGATLGQVSRLEIDSCANQSVIGIITNEKESNNYMYLSILNSVNDLVLKQTGGAQQHINKNDVETHEIIAPSMELISQFDEIIRPLFEQISVNCFEINNMEQLRDTLLPKLMNGEIDLDNIEI